jgi:signal peptidase I
VYKRSITMLAFSLSLSGCGAVNALSDERNYTIPSVAMEPTLESGESFRARTVDPGDYNPERGDIVVFTTPKWGSNSGSPYVKRVIAIGGDRIACCSPQGLLLLNGKPLSEPYLPAGSIRSARPFTPVTVPNGHLWLMGDNRENSNDSLSHHARTGKGTVPAEAVIGIVETK